MGKVTPRSLLAGSRGRIGPVVVTGWLAIDVIKGRPSRKRKKGKKQTEGQLAQQEIFGKVMYLLTPVQKLINVGFQQPRNPTSMPVNAAVSLTRTTAVFSIEGKEYIDLSKIKLSKPIHRTETTWNPVVKAEAGRKITVSWELNPFPEKCTRLDDRMLIAFFDQEMNVFSMTHGTAERSACTFSNIRARNTLGHEIFVYTFLVSADGKLVSDTDCLGPVTVIA